MTGVDIDDLAPAVDEVAAATGFSGVVRVDRAGSWLHQAAFGDADRRHRIANTVDTRFGIASGTKGFTALVAVSLVEDGHLALDTTAREILGDDLPLIADDVTVEHLLAHRSGIGDYFDEHEVDVHDHVLSVPVHELASTPDYLAVLEGHPTRFAAGERFAYCNSGYVVLALLAERVSGRTFHELVLERVCVPAELRHTAFVRSDELDATAAVGYLHAAGLRTNVLHLPVVGSGDGGLYTTVGDVHALWTALFSGLIVSDGMVAAMVAPRSDVPDEGMRYGLGFWLHATRDAVILEGADAGVSFRSLHEPSTGLTCTVVSNTTEGAWPVAGRLEGLLVH